MSSRSEGRSRLIRGFRLYRSCTFSRDRGIVRVYIFRILFDFCRISWKVQKRDFGHPQRKCMYVISCIMDKTNIPKYIPVKTVHSYILAAWTPQWITDDISSRIGGQKTGHCNFNVMLHSHVYNVVMNLVWMFFLPGNNARSNLSSCEI